MTPPDRPRTRPTERVRRRLGRSSKSWPEAPTIDGLNGAVGSYWTWRISYADSDDGKTGWVKKGTATFDPSTPGNPAYDVTFHDFETRKRPTADGQLVRGDRDLHLLARRLRRGRG